MQASSKEVTWVMRVTVVVTGIMAAAVAITANHVLGLLYLAYQTAFLVLFPALICAIFVPFSNAWGCLVGVIAGMFLGISAGEPLLRMPALFRYPLFYEEWQAQGFPFRTVCGVLLIFCVAAVSWVTERWCRRRNTADITSEQETEQCL